MWQLCVVVGQCPGLPGLTGVPARRSPKANPYHHHLTITITKARATIEDLSQAAGRVELADGESLERPHRVVRIWRVARGRTARHACSCAIIHLTQTVPRRTACMATQPLTPEAAQWSGYAISTKEVQV
jgi:hypothetical protein